MAKVASGMGIELDALLKMLDGKQSVQLIENDIDSPQTPVYSTQCKEIIEVCEQLTPHNQRKVFTYSKNLLSTQQMEEDLLAAHVRTDVEQTPEGVQHDLDIMNDDSQWE